MTSRKMRDMQLGGTLSKSTWWLVVTAATLGACLYLTRRVMFSSDDLLPVGIDTLGHLTKVYTLAQRWREFKFGDWFPNWYMGSTIGQYYPPLSLWIGAVIQIATGKILLTYKILSLGCLLLGGLATANLTRRFGGGLAACTLASVAYSTASYTLFTVFSDGTLGRIVCLALYPFLLSVLLDLVERPLPARLLLSASLIALMVLAHILQAYLMFVTVALFMLPWCLLGERKLKSILVLAETSITGVLLSSFWVIPGVTQLETPGVPWSPPEIMGATTLSLKMLFAPSSLFASTVMFIGAAAGMMLLAADTRSRRLAVSLICSALITATLVLGAANPVFNILPMRDTIRPLRFINALVLPTAVSFGLLIDLLLMRVFPRGSHLLKTWAGLGLAVCLLALSVAVNKGPNLGGPDQYRALSDLVSEIPSGGSGLFGTGRVAEELPRSGGESAFLPVSRGLNITAGWNIEGTTHQYTLYDHNLAYSDGYYDYILRDWYLWNARSALIDIKYSPMIDRLVQDGWTRVDTQDEVALLANPRPSTYLMSPNTDAIAIGRSSSFVCRLLPWVTQGREADPLAYDEEYLDLFRCIILYDLPQVDKAQLEKRVIAWVREGKTVIMDLSVTDSVSEFLGVRHSDVPVGGQVTFATTPQGREILGTDLTVDVSQGRGATYIGLDQVYATISTESGPLAVCGARELQFGNVYFIGGHLPRLVEDTSAGAARSILNSLVSLANPGKDIVPQPFEASHVDWAQSSARIVYDSSESRNLLVSVTYSPRWRARIDSVPVPIYRHENLMLVVVPSGSHTVDLVYGGTWVTAAGWGITILAALWLAFSMLRYGHSSGARVRAGGGHIGNAVAPHVQ